MPNGCMSTGGSGLNWFVRTFAGGETAAAERDGAQHPPASRPPRGRRSRPAPTSSLFLPYLLGEKTPIHDPQARGVIDGLTLSHDIGHLWRALLEGYAYAIAHHIEVLNDMGHADEPLLRLRWRFEQPGMDADRRRCAATPGAAAQRPSRLLARRRLDRGGRRRPRRLAGHLRASSNMASTLQPDPRNAQTYGAGYRRYRELYRRAEARSKDVP